MPSATRPNVPGRAKLAEVVARQIEDDIVASGWRVGTVVGSSPKTAVARADGLTGIRVNHQLEVHIDGLAVTK